MPKFAVAYVNAFDNDLQITVVEAVDCVRGIYEGARILMKPDDETSNWLDTVFTEAVNETDTNNLAIEQIQNKFFDCDCNIVICEVGE